MRQKFNGICEWCQQPFEKWKRGNQPYRFCAVSCSTRANNRLRCKLPEGESRIRRIASVRRWEKKNPDKVKKMKRDSYRRNAAEIRKRMNPKNLERARALRSSLLDAFGGKCCKCGCDDFRVLQVDHMNGGGNQERRRIGNSYSFNKKVLANQSGYQLLCANCNWIKKHEEHEHRWKQTTSTITED